jgi:hypothetical protein
MRTRRAQVRKDAAKQVYRLTDIEVEEVSIVDRAANQMKFVLVKSAGAPVLPDGAGGLTTEDETSKAVWTTAYINSLPDSAFLHVDAGGTKDSEGKTTPRSLRHFPVKDANGTVDLPHLRNALARIPQSSLPQGVKDKATAEATRMLASANKADPAAVDPGTEPPKDQPPGPQAEPQLRLSPEAKAELNKRLALATERIAAIGKMIATAQETQGVVEIPSELIAKIGELLTGIEQGDVSKAEAVAKGLPQFSSSRIGALTAARDALDNLLGQVVKPEPAPEPAPAPEPPPGIDGAEVGKRLVALEAKIEKALGGLTTIVARQSEAIQKQSQRVDSLDRGVVPSNGSESTPVTVPVVKEDNAWPMDMASPDYGRKID